MVSNFREGRYHSINNGKHSPSIQKWLAEASLETDVVEEGRGRRACGVVTMSLDKGIETHSLLVDD